MKMSRGDHFPAASWVDAILDKENFTLKELLQEEELMEELRESNSRLINFLSGKEQVKQLLRYIVGDTPEVEGDTKCSSTSCDILTSDVDAISNTLVADDELMDLLFSFLEPNRDHKAELAGYFRKVVLHLIYEKTLHFMNYIRGGHHDVFRRLVDLIEVSAITELLIKLLAECGRGNVCPEDVEQWLSNSNLLEMIVDKLDPNNAPRVHSNASEILCAVAGNVGSLLAMKLSTPRFIEMLFGHALQDPGSESSFLYSLSVCVTLLDQKRADNDPPLDGMSGNVHPHFLLLWDDDSIPKNAENINATLPNLGDLLRELNSSNANILPTTSGESKPTLRKHCVKIVELVAVLVRANSDAVERELVGSGIIRRIIDIFFEYAFDVKLHNLVKSIVSTCLGGKRRALIAHLIHDCNLVGRILPAENNLNITDIVEQATVSSAGTRQITTMADLLDLSSRNNILAETLLQESNEWNDWLANISKQRNDVQNTHGWACSRPAGPHNNDEVIEIVDEASHDDDNQDASLDDEPPEASTSSLSLGDNKVHSICSCWNWWPKA